MNGLKVLHSPQAIARRVRELGEKISRDFRGKTVDVVGLVDNGFVFMADLVRTIRVPVRYHFIRTEVFHVTDADTGKPRKEIFYTPEIEAAGKNILLVDGVLQSGVTTDFLLRRIGLHQPRMLKTAVCVDKPEERKVPLKPDYCAFRIASNLTVVGYGLSWQGLHGNLPYLGSWSPQRRSPSRRRTHKGRRSKRR